MPHVNTSQVRGRAPLVDDDGLAEVATGECRRDVVLRILVQGLLVHGLVGRHVVRRHGRPRPARAAATARPGRAATQLAIGEVGKRGIRECGAGGDAGARGDAGGDADLRRIYALRGARSGFRGWGSR